LLEAVHLKSDTVRGQSMDELSTPPVLSALQPNAAYLESMANVIAATAMPPGGAGGGGNGGSQPAAGGTGGSYLAGVPAIPIPLLPGVTAPPVAGAPVTQMVSIPWITPVAGISSVVSMIPGASASSTPAWPAIVSLSWTPPDYPSVSPPAVLPPNGPAGPGNPTTPAVGPDLPPGSHGQPSQPGPGPNHPPGNHALSEVPEPATMFLIGLGMILISLRLRKVR
jgi:hypothetical protein